MKRLIPALLLVLVGAIQTAYSFTKFDFTVATITSSFSWLIIILVMALIKVQKRRMQYVYKNNKPKSK